ncbi:LOW QUALITY PROTEIN: hypothetical protein OSB04_un001486 [Centaurea solstitialis]|uniref:Transposase MuDR plant domain-containing protein n=1 Tax=Centaurea solstitialis TaxID=347529 RepID=A0AA38S495_9ASTR|nr:LOW QUALITY PROTEIN: hypothetical protein OSB04_un001486 [Centaurea solstitialis]
MRSNKFVYICTPLSPLTCKRSNESYVILKAPFFMASIFANPQFTLFSRTQTPTRACPYTRRSMSGYCVYLGDNIVSWSSKRQATLSRSSAEAKYRRVANYSRLVGFAISSWSFTTHSQQETIVYCDNVNTIYLAGNPVQHQRTKHNRNGYSFHAGKGSLRPSSSSTCSFAIADIFTKGLPRILFEDFLSSLSIHFPPASTAGALSLAILLLPAIAAGDCCPRFRPAIAALDSGRRLLPEIPAGDRFDFQTCSNRLLDLLPIDCSQSTAPNRFLPMENSSENIVDETSKPMWENMVESPIVEHMPLSKYKLKLKYGGFFRLAKNSSKKIYCFGSQKCIYIETWSYNLSQLWEEVIKRYSSKNNPQFSIVFLDKNAPGQSFIELDSEETFMVMLHMYVQEKEVIIYVTTENNHDSNKVSLSNNLCDNRADPNGEDDSDYCVSEESYHSHLSSDNEDELMNYEDEDYSCINNSLSMKVNSKFANVIEFRRALNHYAITNEFDYLIVKSDPIRFTARCEKIDCEWKIHASIMQDGVTFEVKTMVEGHTCTRSSKGGHKRATQGWIASVVTSRLKSDGDVTVAELTKWLMRVYNVDVPYQKVFRGKEQAYSDMYGKWEDSFMKMDGLEKNSSTGTKEPLPKLILT